MKEMSPKNEALRNSIWGFGLFGVNESTRNNLLSCSYCEWQEWLKVIANKEGCAFITIQYIQRWCLDVRLFWFLNGAMSDCRFIVALRVSNILNPVSESDKLLRCVLLPFLLRFPLKSKSPQKSWICTRASVWITALALEAGVPPLRIFYQPHAHNESVKPGPCVGHSVETVKQTCWLVNLLPSCRL